MLLFDSFQNCLVVCRVFLLGDGTDHSNSVRRQRAVHIAAAGGFLDLDAGHLLAVLLDGHHHVNRNVLGKGVRCAGAGTIDLHLIAHARNLSCHQPVIGFKLFLGGSTFRADVVLFFF